MLFLACCAGCGSNNTLTPASPVKPDKAAYSLRLKLMKGDRLEYSFHQVDVTTQPATQAKIGFVVEVDIRANLVETVTGVEDGVYELSTQLVDPQVVVKCEGDKKGYEDEIRKAKLGSLADGKLKLDARYRNALSPAGGLKIALPEGETKIGASWQVEVPEAAKAGDPGKQLQHMMPVFKLTFEGIDQIGKWKCARIVGILDPPGLLRLEKPATTWFDLETGAIVRSTLDMSIDMQPLLKSNYEMDLKSFTRGR